MQSEQLLRSCFLIKTWVYVVTRSFSGAHTSEDIRNFWMVLGTKHPCKPPLHSCCNTWTCKRENICNFCLNLSNQINTVDVSGGRISLRILTVVSWYRSDLFWLVFISRGIKTYTVTALQWVVSNNEWTDDLFHSYQRKCKESYKPQRINFESGLTVIVILFSSLLELLQQVNRLLLPVQLCGFHPFQSVSPLVDQNWNFSTSNPLFPSCFRLLLPPNEWIIIGFPSRSARVS